MSNLIEHVYIKFINPCKNPIGQHKSTCIVPVTDVLNFEKCKENKNREFKVKCGSSKCLAVIGIIDSKYKIRKYLKPIINIAFS